MVAFPSPPVPVVALQDDPGLDVELRDPVRPGAEPLAAGLRPGMAPVAVDLVRLQTRPTLTIAVPKSAASAVSEERLRPAEVEDERAPVGALI